MNYRLRSTSPDYHVHPTGQFLVPNSAQPAPQPQRPPVEIPPHPTGPMMLNGKAMESSGSYADIFNVLFRHVPPGRGTDGSVIFHAGACMGKESEVLYRNYYRPMWIFEPDPRNLDVLRRRMHDLEQQHGFTAKVLPFAVGDRDGRTEFRLSNSEGGPWTESSTMMVPKDHLKQSPELNWREVVEVGICKLDSVWRNIGKPAVHLLWTDVECAELPMLRGAQEMLRHTRFAFFEWSKSERHEGALNLQQTYDLLPGKWEALAVFDHGFFGDLLVRNLEA